MENSRQIKFRAWDTKEKKMLEVLSLEFFATSGSVCSKEDFKNKIPMQYTGLKDKNGKDVCECDIVEIYSKITKTQTKGEVKYLEDACAFMIKDTIFNQFLPLTVSDDVEVIGNIYENKELLNNIKENK